MAYSKLTSKFQATIPQEIRIALNLKAGDAIEFEITEDKNIILKKAKSLDRAYLRSIQSTLEEWSSPYDDEDYNDL